jgi:hypothetical protein
MVVNGRGMLVEFKDRGELWDSNTVDRIEWGIIEPFRDRAQLMRWPASSAARQGGCGLHPHESHLRSPPRRAST